jgi:hypothetical protein
VREYKGLGRCAIQLDSRRLSATTQYIRQEFIYSDILSVSFVVPNVVKNGCLTFEIAENSIPVYFAANQTEAMAEAFDIINAIYKGLDGNPEKRPATAGRKLAVLRCVRADHPVLRHAGRMKFVLSENSLRLEYPFVTQGCTIDLGDIKELALTPHASEMSITCARDNSTHTLTFSGRKCLATYRELSTALSSAPRISRSAGE